MQNLDHEILVAAAATRLRGLILDQSRELGAMLKARGVSVQKTQFLMLDIYAEGIEVLKKLRQEIKSS